MKLRALLVILFILPQSVSANTGHDLFFKRIHEARMMVAEHDLRSVEDISRELQETNSPAGNLQIYEAIAATYRDLMQSGKFNKDEEKKKLYDQIRMNMAFIQFGGDPQYGGGKKINLWIRQTLVKYLPDDLINDENMFYSADEWENK